MRKIYLAVPSGLIALALLTACTSGPDPKVTADALSKANDTYLVCVSAQVDNENSDDPYTSQMGWEAEQSCLDDFASTLKGISVEEKYKDDRNSVIATVTQLSAAAGLISANTEDVSNYNDNFAAYQTTRTDLLGKISKLFLDYGISD